MLAPWCDPTNSLVAEFRTNWAFLAPRRPSFVGPLNILFHAGGRIEVSDDAFRWVVAGGVILAALAALGQLVVMLGLYRVAREVQIKIAGLAERVGSVLDTAITTLDENKPKILAITENATALAVTARQSTERINDLLADTAPRVKARIRQIDEAIGVSTIRFASLTGDVMRIVRVARGVGAAVAAFRRRIRTREGATREQKG